MSSGTAMGIGAATGPADAIWSLLDSPVGQLLLTSDGVALTAVFFDRHRSGDDHRPLAARRPDSRDDGHPVLGRTRRQLTEYFAGERRDFDLPLAPQGTPFQRRVWSALLDIPYGETASYGEVARRLALLPGASRAVGLANGSNPISIIIPCHRVIGADGSLTGYGGGLDRKRYLLDLERDLLF
jgi:methylated-DNA-[protein]-cysteine S-methyltransferase